MSLPFSQFSLNALEEPKGRRSKKKEEEDKGRWFSILGHRRKELTPKRRRGLVLRALRSNVVRTSKPRNVLASLTRVRKSNGKTKPDPRYYFDLHRYVRRKL